MHVVMLLSVPTGPRWGRGAGTRTGAYYRGPDPTMLHTLMSLTTVPLSAGCTQLTPSDKPSPVTLQLTVGLSDLEQRFLAGPPLLGARSPGPEPPLAGRGYSK